MRVAFIRTDISREYLSDIENSSQRNFSSEPQGQSRYLHKPTDTELANMLAVYGRLTIRGSDTAATVDTSVANGTKLNIRIGSTATYSQITVTSSATAAKTAIVTELNAGFVAAGLGLTARISGTNQVAIDTTLGGPDAYVSISASSPSTGALHTVLGLAASATTGLSVAALKAAVYPSATTVNVAPATINALSTFSLLATATQTSLDTAVADLVAPSLVETGPVLLSFVYGVLSKLRSSTFQPGGARIGLAAGAAVAIVANDGSTVYSI